MLPSEFILTGGKEGDSPPNSPPRSLAPPRAGNKTAEAGVYGRRADIQRQSSARAIEPIMNRCLMLRLAAVMGLIAVGAIDARFVRAQSPPKTVFEVASIKVWKPGEIVPGIEPRSNGQGKSGGSDGDRKSTRLNSSHSIASRMPSSA